MGPISHRDRFRMAVSKMKLPRSQRARFQFLFHDSVIHGCPSIPSTFHQFFTRLVGDAQIKIDQNLIDAAYHEKAYRHLKQQHERTKKTQVQGVPLFTPYLKNGRFKDLIADIYAPFVPLTTARNLLGGGPNSLFGYLVKYYNYDFQHKLQTTQLKHIFQLLGNYSKQASIGFLLDANWLNFNLSLQDVPFTYYFNSKRPRSVNLSNFQSYLAFENMYSLEYQSRMNKLLLDEFSGSLSKNTSTVHKYIISRDNSGRLENFGYKVIRISQGKSDISDLLMKYNACLANFDIQLSTLLDIYNTLLHKDVITVKGLDELSKLLIVFTSMIEAN